MQGRGALCDFCSEPWDPMDHRWTCHHAEQIQIVVDRQVIYNAHGNWLVCHNCNEFVQKHEWKALAFYCANRHPDKSIRSKAVLVKACYDIARAFAKAWLSYHLLHEKRECLTQLPQVH